MDHTPGEVHRPADGGPAAARDSGPMRRADQARRVADVLRRQIARGDFGTRGDSGTGVLPDERTLTREFTASRNAVREALSLLRGEGLVERRQGVGTVVVSRPYEHPLSGLSGLAEVLHQHGSVVNTVREARPAQPPAEVARRLALPPGEQVVYLERLRELDGVPVSLDCTYLLPGVGGKLLELPLGDLQHHDVFWLLENAAEAPLGRAEVSVQAVVADAATCAVLGMPQGGAVLALERLTRLSDGTPADLEFIHLRGDRLTLHAELDRTARP